LGIEWTKPEDPFQQNYTKDQTKEGIEEKIMEKDKHSISLVEKLLEKEGEYFRKNVYNLLGLLESEAKWLLDEDNQNETNINKKFSSILRVLKVTNVESLQKLLLLF